MPTYHATFMSHAHADNDLIVDYAARLRSKGIDLWLDLSDAQKGHDLSNDIIEQLERRSALVLMVTAASNDSRWVAMVVSNFIALYNDKQLYRVNGVERLILPIRLEDVYTPGRLRLFNYIDAVGRSHEQVTDDIVRALQVTSHLVGKIASPVSVQDISHKGPSPATKQPPSIAMPKSLLQDSVPLPHPKRSAPLIAEKIPSQQRRRVVVSRLLSWLLAGIAVLVVVGAIATILHRGTANSQFRSSSGTVQATRTLQPAFGTVKWIYSIRTVCRLFSNCSQWHPLCWVG